MVLSFHSFDILIFAYKPVGEPFASFRQVFLVAVVGPENVCPDVGGTSTE
jgi:hypothetical protein